MKVLESKNGAVLVGGGHLAPLDLQQITDFNGAVFCADAGYLALGPLGIEIAGIIGDMDSVGKLYDVDFPVLHFEDQDTTDLEKSLASINAPYLLCYGFLGGRLDHSLAAFNALAKSDQLAFLIGTVDVAVICPRQIDLNLPPQTRFSLFPLTPTQARSTGLLWNVDGVDLNPVGMVSTSNQVKDPQISISIDDGQALIIFPRDVLAIVLEQWPT